MPRYNSIDTIPAKVFFDILHTKNYQLLKPKPREKGLEAIFISIYDVFFVQSDNSEAKRYLDLVKNISFLEYKIAVIKQTLHFTFYNKMTKSMFTELTEALKSGCGIEVNTEIEYIDEVQRILQVEIGIIENDLNMDKLEYQNMIAISKGKDYNYFDAIVGLSNVLPSNALLKEQMSLATYIALEKLANKIIKEQNKK